MPTDERTTTGGAREALEATARSLKVDVATAEVVSALRRAGVQSVLLRGPSIARLLYGDGALRSYVDADLLVSPQDSALAGRVLTGLGFAPLAGDEDVAGHRPPHAHEWERDRDRAQVDLHRTVAGAGVSPADVWAALSRETEPMHVGGREVDVLSAHAQALVLTLHSAHHGPLKRKPRRDLERALDLLPDAAWESAARLAALLEATPAFAAGLSLFPAGRVLSARLGLPSERSVELVLRSWGAPPLARGLDWLLRTPGLRAKAALVARTLFPSRGAMRIWRPLARRGRRGLAVAYASHPFWLVWHVVPSYLALRRARKETHER